MKDLCSEKVYKKAEEIITRHICDEVILVPVRGKLGDMEQIYSFDSVSEFIWENLDGEKNVEDICCGVLENFDVKMEVVQSDVTEFISHLESEGLITEVTR